MKDLSIPIDLLGSIYYLKVVSDFPFDITGRVKFVLRSGLRMPF